MRNDSTERVCGWLGRESKGAKSHFYFYFIRNEVQREGVFFAIKVDTRNKAGFSCKGMGRGWLGISGI